MRSVLKLFVFLALGFLFSECNDPTFLGADLLKEDEINLSFVDTFTLEAQTLLDSDQTVYYPAIGQVFGRMAIGNFQDQLFGNTDAGLFIQFLKPAFAALPEFKGADLDSAILYFSFDTLVTPYGVPFDNHDFEVYKMDQRIKLDFAYKTNNTDLSFVTPPIGALSGVRPDPKLRIIVGTDSISYDPHLAFKLNREYAKSIMNLDTLTYNSDSIFLANVPGFYIRQANPNFRMMNFNPNSVYSKFTIYYTSGGSAKNYSFPFNQTQIAFTSPRVPAWKHTFSPRIKEALNNKKKGEELIYLQSMAGLKAKIEFPNLKLDPKAIINKAELEFTVIDLPGDDKTIYPYAKQLALYVKDTTTGEDNFISDQGGLSNYSFMGGTLASKTVNGETISYYVFNVSNHIQRALAGKVKSELYLGIAPESLNQVIPTPVNLSRVVLGGPKHPVNPAKLRISYTTY
jgi:hypothetical protein